MITIKTGDLLLCDEEYICHQTNTVSTKSAGLAYTIFMEEPTANTYNGQYAKTRKLGTIDYNDCIINLNAQKYPGRANYDDDTAEMRLSWFKQCLLAISKIKDVDSLAFPYKIGCNLGGGNWEDYLEILLNFSDYADNIDIVIYKLKK